MKSTGFVAVALACLLHASTQAQVAAPAATRAVRVDERIGARVPTELVFTTPEGEPARLDAYVRSGAPTVLVFAYARCRSLCSVVLQRMSELIRATPALAPGRDYRLLLVGLDPNQSLEEARRHQATLLQRCGLAGQNARFPYLLGKRAQVEALASAVGFRYTRDERTNQYVHPAVLIVLDGQARVFRYLHALGNSAQDFEGAVRAAASGHPAQPETARSSLAGELLRCYRFDPALRRHQASIDRYFRVGGALIFMLLTGLIAGLFVWERRRSL
jgi:protein SCO1/2